MELEKIVDTFNFKAYPLQNQRSKRALNLSYLYSRDTNCLLPLLQSIENYYARIVTNNSEAVDFILEAENLFYKDSSPYSSDEVMIFLVNKTLERSELDDMYKIRPQYILGNILKNRVGRRASDFEYLGKEKKWKRDFDIWK